MLCLLAMTGESGLCVDIKGELSQATAELLKVKDTEFIFLILSNHKTVTAGILCTWDLTNI